MKVPLPQGKPISLMADGQDKLMKKIQIEDLRSRKWFMNADNREMTALYLERYLNYGLTRKELQSGKPIIAIAQTGSDLPPATATIWN